MTRQTLCADMVKAGLAQDASLVHSWLARAFQNKGITDGLLEAMEYSLLAGGKRIRPALCLNAARLFGLADDKSLPFAGALECIHTYSLIHDDLPAMDDDDLRRGKASNHKAFGEAAAILAGDALLTDAFGLMASCTELGVPADRVVRAMALAAGAAGSLGMVGGQYLDMLYTAKKDVSLEQVASMQAMKTGAMIRLACESGAVLAGAGEDDIKAMRVYGQAIGASFQITDDILDETGTEEELGKPVGSDAALAKNTYPSLLGLDASRQEALRHTDIALQAIAAYTRPEAAVLRGLAAYIANRVQ